MKSLTSRATDLSARRELRPVPLVVLTTYTARDAATVDTTYYFSDRTVYYDYANTGTEREFGAFLMAIEPLIQSMNHIPDLAAGALDRQLTIRLANTAVDAGSRLYEVLEAKRLLFATVEVAQILMDPGKRETLASIRALTGAEHQVWFRGEVVAHGADEAQIQLSCQATQRGVPWIVANVPTTNDPKDVGRRLPVVYGARKRVPAVGWSVGWQTTLAATLTSSATGNTAFTDVSGLSGSGISIRLGQEEVTATYVDDQTLNITARGANSTTAQNHGIGEVAIEMISTIVFVVAGHAVKAINDVYLQNPATGELARITGAYTKTISDSSTISGETVASVSFTAAQLRSVLEDLFPDVLAAGEPQVIDIEFTETTETSTTSSTASAGVSDSTVSNLGSTPRLTGTGGAGTPAETLQFSLATGATGEDGREVIRWRSRVVYNLHQIGGHTSSNWRIRIEIVPQNWPDTDPGESSGSGAATNAPDDVYGAAAVSDWESPTSRNVEELEGADIAVRLSFAAALNNQEPDATEYVEVQWAGAQIEVSPPSAKFSGSLVGFGLRLFADVDGPVASGGNYTVSNGTLLEHPSDILRHIIADLCGYGHGAVDDTTFDALVTALGSGAAIAPILNELGDDFPSIVQALAMECRANLVQEESASATVFKVYAASTSWAWGASERTIDAYLSLSSESRDGSQVATRFRALYAPDLSKDSDRDLWTKALRADPDASDLTGLTTANLVDAEEDFGRRDHPGLVLPSTYDDATAEDVITYYGKELSRDARVIRVNGIPWWLAYDIERGSIVSITPRWASSPFKCRVVSYTKNFQSELVDATLVEVA